jgi:hypothetical protein
LRTGWKDNTTLQELVRCVDRDGGAQMVAEITVATRDALKQLESEWEAADSTSGFEFRPDGTVRLRNTPAAAIDKLTGRDGVRTGLSLLGGSGDVARIRWDAGQSSQTQISDITVRLNPKVTGAGKTVAFWKLQLYYKDVSSGVTQLTPLLWDPVTVPAPGDFESDVTFDLSGLNQRPQPLVMGDLGAGQPTTFVEVWGVQADGVTLATNVGWARDSTVPNYTASGNTLEGYTLTKAFSDTYNLDFWSEVAWGYPPIIRVRFVTYSGSATLSFTGANLLDLGAVPTGHRGVRSAEGEPGRLEHHRADPERRRCGLDYLQGRADLGRHRGLEAADVQVPVDPHRRCNRPDLAGAAPGRRPRAHPVALPVLDPGLHQRRLMRPDRPEG